MAKAPLCLIAAVARNGVIGRGNELVWRDPVDAKHFRATTMGCPVLMGRKTWDSLPAKFRPLPGRRNLVVTRQRDWAGSEAARGAEVVFSLDEALAAVAETEAPRVFVMGGGELYALALPRADVLELTEIEAELDGDVRFPDWPRADFEEVARTAHPGFAFVTYRRR
ncbi:dihydrofolate reductase [Sphaerotilus sp.]|uniref:dihydrofolate reductase n=1 Tax=Sphaerotilus sp. TaxID=2093942 RepID=UPI002ACDE317|nr:dihydrofolate reductase [Sphaerotilus sp.]MDZ7856449.1 dihydrofolate reductase [Sphaerotilus sp.]